ncbi:MAG: hypothetical protein K2H70_01335, partial [Bacteroidales bacterium]|nr:hypothetical protein [Bacteroidales bacterium]
MTNGWHAAAKVSDAAVAPLPDGGPVTTAIKAASDWKAPEVRLVVPDVRMCPGQVYDLPVYIETDGPVSIVDLTVGFRFPHYMIVEPVDNTYTDLHPDMRLRGGALAHYNKAPSKPNEPLSSLPDHCWTLNWYTTRHEDPFVPQSGDVLFRVRVRYKQEGEGMVDFINDSYVDEGFGDFRDFTHMTIVPPPAVGKQMLLFPACDTSYVRAAMPPVVEAMTDTTVCVNSKTRLWATGGVRYAWRDISPVEYVYRPALNDTLTANPIFCPLDPGYYTYEVKITDKTGCSARDTVQYLVLDNGLNLDLPSDTLVEAGQPADLTASVYGGYPPYSLSWSPAELTAIPTMTGLMPARTGGRVDTANHSLPLERPQWFDVTVEDRYCTFGKRQSVNVAGSEIEGVLTLDPPHFCQGAPSHVVDLHIDARGGYGRYSYAWSAENVAPGGQAPIFETLTNNASARLRCYERCVVR